MFCAHCGTKNEETIESCDRCGELLARMDPSHVTHLGIRACPECGTVNQPRASYCTDCGQNLDQVVTTAGPSRSAQPPQPAVPIGTRRSPVSPAPPPSTGTAEVRRPIASPARPSGPTGETRDERSARDLRSDSTPEVTAQNDSGTPEAKLPEELKGWNWGGLFLPFVWGPFNRVWIGLAVLLAFLPIPGTVTILIYGPAALYVGMRGNELAWRARKWDSVDHFRTVQAQWARWSLIGFIPFLMITLAVVGPSGG